MKNKNWATIIIALSVFTTTLFGQHSATVTKRFSQIENTIVLSIPNGQELKYENAGINEIERVGPAAFAINAAGEFIIADTPTSRLLWFSKEGVKIREVTIEDAVGITDIKLHEGDIYVLDSSALEPSVFHLNPAGSLIEKVTISDALRDQGLTGIQIGKAGQLLFELRDGAALVGADQNRVSREIHSLGDFNTPFFDTAGASNRQTDIYFGDRKFQQIKVENTLAGIQPLNVSSNGDVIIVVTELTSTPTIFVDETVRRYDRKGHFLGMARVPISENYAYVQNNLVVAEDGRVFAMINKQNSIDIVELQFTEKLPSILPLPVIKAVDSVTEPSRAAACSITRAQIAANAEAFLNNRVNLSSTNISGTCSGRGKPRSLGAAGSYSSVLYDWGGDDSVDEFNYFMGRNYQAGDIDTANSESCSRGVDCSGFVSRAWATSRYTTASLPSISAAISQSELQTGDILNKSNDHVVLFHSPASSNGVNAWEATVSNNVDRVVKVFSAWSRLNGYTPRRYNNICEIGSFNLFTSPTTITVTRGSMASYSVYYYTNDGFRGTINFSALNLPNNQVLSGTGFYPGNVNVQTDNTWYSTQFRIYTNSATPRGSFPITVKGVSGGKTSSTVIYLKVL